MNKSEKFRELLVEEKRLQNQLMDCETAQSRMLKKAFKGLGLKVGCFGEIAGGRADIAIIEITEWSVRYYRNTSVQIKIHEISLEDLFDTEER